MEDRYIATQQNAKGMTLHTARHLQPRLTTVLLRRASDKVTSFGRCGGKVWPHGCTTAASAGTPMTLECAAAGSAATTTTVTKLSVRTPAMTGRR